MTVHGVESIGLNRHKGSNQTSHQGIQLKFADTLINADNEQYSPSAALSDIDAVDTAAARTRP